VSAASCSYCSELATHVGNGQDGDLYCPAHLGAAWNGATPIDEPVRIITRSVRVGDVVRSKASGKFWSVDDAGTGRGWIATVSLDGHLTNAFRRVEVEVVAKRDADRLRAEAAAPTFDGYRPGDRFYGEAVERAMDADQ
jgi:hypothetical protein